MAKYNDKFVQWLVCGNDNQNYLLGMINVYYTLNDDNGLWHAVVSLKHIVKAVNYTVLNNTNNINTNLNNNLNNINLNLNTNINTNNNNTLISLPAILS